MDHRAAQEFLEGYRTTFESLEAAAITAKFAFPCQVIGQADGVTISAATDAQQWAASIERIVAAYRVLGVASASASSVQVLSVTSGCALVLVTWDLESAGASRVYSFTACYTVVETDDGPRIAAIVHDEGPKLQQALASHRA
ncbi:MAG: hypothetical protein KDB60_14295 [Propionibacteriaceae bacterium]|nr:hypothetical protein [Propionibacteriaceae bacterium]